MFMPVFTGEESVSGLPHGCLLVTQQGHVFFSSGSSQGIILFPGTLYQGRQGSSSIRPSPVALVLALQVPWLLRRERKKGVFAGLGAFLTVSETGSEMEIWTL